MKPIEKMKEKLAAKNAENNGKAPVKTKKPAKEQLEPVKTKVDFEPELKMTNEELEMIFEGDLSDLDQFTDVITEVEKAKSKYRGLTASDRIKRAMTFRRARVKIKRSRQLAMRRRATSTTIGKRSRRSAIEILKKRFGGGRDPSQMSNSEKNRIERIMHMRKSAVVRLARKLVSSKRREENTRLSRK